MLLLFVFFFLFVFLPLIYWIVSSGGAPVNRPALNLLSVQPRGVHLIVSKSRGARGDHTL